MLSIRVRFSQLAISPHKCSTFIKNELKQRDRLCVKIMDTRPESDQIAFMPVSLLYEIKFVTMEDISTPTYQRIIGLLRMDGNEYRYILISTNGEVVLHLTHKDNPSIVKTRIVLPLSMDTRAPYSIFIPEQYSKAYYTIPNEITWEFLNQFYCPHDSTATCTKFPVL